MTPGEGRTVALSWIVVCHESHRDLGVLLPSLVRALDELDQPTELIVVDNASTDGSESLVRRLAPRARFMRRPTNEGYGVAANRGAALARGRWLAVTNADLFIPRGGLGSLLGVLDGVDDDVALVGPALHDPEGRPRLSAGRFPTLATLLAGLARPCDRRKYVGPGQHRAGPVDWMTGACLFARATAFDAAGGFDPDFFLYYEDVDLARRLARRGLRSMFTPDVSVMHVRPHHGRPPQALIERHVRASRMAYFRNHRPAWESGLLALLARIEPFVRRREPLLTNPVPRPWLATPPSATSSAPPSWSAAPPLAASSVPSPWLAAPQLAASSAPPLATRPVPAASAPSGATPAVLSPALPVVPVVRVERKAS